jgi:thiol-disulfide isomerase/thioredoxin
MSSELLEFYGTECPHCVRMHELVEKLEKEEKGIKVDTFEVWHNEENARKLEEIDKDFCGGVPFFYNMKTSKWICGEAKYQELKDWALGK